MSALLIVSAGKSDLQVATSVNGRNVRLRMAEQTLRATHEALLAEFGRYVLDEPAAAYSEAPENSIRWNEEQVCLEHTAGGNAIPAVVPFPVPIAPAKLAGIRMALAKNVPSAVIVFNTRRDSKRDEPVAAGPILSRWLAELFNLEWCDTPGVIGCGKSGWINFLYGTMRAEGQDREGVNRKGVGAIDEALKRVGNFASVCFALGGGMPDFREQIRSAARFRFRNARFSEFRAPEGGRPNMAEAGDPLILPSESFRARQQVRMLVCSGDFMGAAIVARPFAREHWTLPLQWAAEYFDGRQDSRDEYDDYLHELSTENVPRCLLPAMRVEAALRNGRFRDAILDTASFKDAALIDYIGRFGFVSSIDELEQTLTMSAGGCPEILITAIDGESCLERRDRKKFRYRTGKKFDSRWLEAMNPKGGPLRAFTTKLDGKLAGELRSARDIRNVIAHSAFSGEMIGEVGKAFVEKAIWMRFQDNQYFLTQPEVAGILSELGCHDPIKLYEAVVNGLLQAMDNYRVE